MRTMNTQTLVHKTLSFLTLNICPLLLCESMWCSAWGSNYHILACLPQSMPADPQCYLAPLTSWNEDANHSWQTQTVSCVKITFPDNHRAGQQPLCAEPSGVAGCHPGEGAEASTSEHPELPSSTQARTASSMLKARLFSEACNISKHHKEAKRLT